MSAQTVMVEVTFVKPPAEGKQYGSIKGANNEWWPVKNDRIREFEPGNKYELAYTESDKGFKNIIGVKKIVAETARPQRFEGAEFREPQRNGATLTTAAAQPKPQAPQQNGNYYRPTAPKDSERMWTCAILGHYVDRGSVDLNEEALIHAVNTLRAVYQKTYGQDD
jgi:hypothetical protein